MQYGAQSYWVRREVPQDNPRTCQSDCVETKGHHHAGHLEILYENKSVSISPGAQREILTCANWWRSLLLHPGEGEQRSLLPGHHNLPLK